MKKAPTVCRTRSRIRTPLTFSYMLYTLRGHIDLVRDMILRRTAA